MHWKQKNASQDKISIQQQPVHTATTNDRPTKTAAVICSFLDDHMESQSYNKHAAVISRFTIWPHITAWKTVLTLVCLKSQSISPFEVCASKVMLWYNFTVFDPSSSKVSYDITISVPQTLSIISEERAQLWKHKSAYMEKWDLELWLRLGVVALSQSQWNSYRSKSMM